MLSPVGQEDLEPQPLVTLAHLDGLALRRAADGWHGVWQVRALDADWIEFFHRRGDDKSPDGAKALPPMSAQPLTAALFDVTAGR